MACPISAQIGNGVMRVRTSLQHSITPLLRYSVIGLTNESPMRQKRPVNKQPATDQILDGNRSPVAAVVAVITVITHGEIAVARHPVRLIRFRQILVAGRLTPLPRPRRHP